MSDLIDYVLGDKTRCQEIVTNYAKATAPYQCGRKPVPGAKRCWQHGGRDEVKRMKRDALPRTQKTLREAIMGDVKATKPDTLVDGMFRIAASRGNYPDLLNEAEAEASEHFGREIWFDLEIVRGFAQAANRVAWFRTLDRLAEYALTVYKVTGPNGEGEPVITLSELV